MLYHFYLWLRGLRSVRHRILWIKAERHRMLERIKNAEPPRPFTTREGIRYILLEHELERLQGEEPA